MPFLVRCKFFVPCLILTQRLFNKRLRFWSDGSLMRLFSVRAHSGNVHVHVLIISSYVNGGVGGGGRSLVSLVRYDVNRPGLRRMDEHTHTHARISADKCTILKEAGVVGIIYSGPFSITAEIHTLRVRRCT